MTKQQLNTPQERMMALRSALEKSLPNIREIAAKHLTPERLIKVVLGAASRTPAILECSPLSIVKAVLQAAELGLEPGSSLGEFWLVPFYNSKTGQKEAQGIPGYRGLIALARRSGEIANISASAVYAGDHFEVELGLEPKLIHRPNYDQDRENPSDLRFVYAVARFKDGSYQFEVLSRKQIDALRRRSKAADGGPWVSDYEEMAKKTAIRRLSKYLPLSVEMARALDLQARAESGDFEDPVIFDIEAEAQPSVENKGGNATLKEKLAATASKAQDDDIPL